jgi:hypothetical protein
MKFDPDTGKVIADDSRWIYTLPSLSDNIRNRQKGSTNNCLPISKIQCGTLYRTLKHTLEQHAFINSVH